MANVDGLYTNQGNGVWGNNNQIIGITRVLAFSTTTPLAANGVYTSPTIDARTYRAYNVTMLSDATGAFISQHSDDGTNWVSTASAAVTANTLTASSTNSLRGYFRIVFTNGAALQTTFSVSCWLSPVS